MTSADVLSVLVRIGGAVLLGAAVAVLWVSLKGLVQWIREEVTGR